MNVDISKYSTISSLPTLLDPVTQICTRSQCEESFFQAYCKELNLTPVVNRKHWEYAYILSVIEKFGFGEPFHDAIGFGVGKEPIPAWLANKGIYVMATDMPGDGGMWGRTNQHMKDTTDLPWDGISSAWAFREYVHYQPVDMNNIGPLWKQGKADIVWSSCSLDHLGTLDLAKQFIRNSLQCLRPGGIAVHTTEYNLTSNRDTILEGPVVIFRQKDIFELQEEMTAEGHHMIFNPYRDPHEEWKIELPPYRNPHLIMMYEKYPITSIGIAIQKGTKE